jgi:exonuclease III
MTFNLTIATWNANGVRGGEGTLTDFLKSHEVDVMAVSETKLTPTDKLRLKDYMTYRLDRPDAVNAGRVALLIHKNVPHAKIKTKIDTSVEVIGVRLVNEIRVHRNTTWDAKLNKIQEGDNALYKIAKLLRKKRAPLGEIVDGNQTAMTDADKSSMLADYYANVHDLHLDEI